MFADAVSGVVQSAQQGGGSNLAQLEVRTTCNGAYTCPQLNACFSPTQLPSVDCRVQVCNFGIAAVLPHFYRSQMMRDC